MMRSRLGLFVFILAFILVFYLSLQYYIQWVRIFWFEGQFDQYNFYATLGYTLQFLLNPILLFVFSYFIGRRVKYKMDLQSVIMPLFLGSIIGCVVIFGYGQLSTSSILSISSIISPISTGLEMFFASFTAMTIAFLRR